MKKKLLFGFPANGNLVKLWRIMRLSFLLLIGFVMTVSAEGYSQAKKMDIKLTNSTIGEVMAYVEKNSNYVFLYRNEDVDLHAKVNISLSNASVEEILDEILEGQALAYDIYERQIVLRKVLEKAVTAVPQKTINGVVTDKQGVPLPGVTVLVKNTTVGAVTDIDGNFRLVLPEDAETLVFSFVGMQSQEIAIDDKQQFMVVMSENAIGLDEVVVVGYGTQKKANLTGAVDQVTGEVFENRTLTNLTQGLQGVMPNLNITLLDGRPNQAPAYNIRGATSIGQGGDALVLIDGVEGDPSLLNPNDIESISLLKDAASASIYGARGAFGVVLITTKNPSKEKTSITYSANFSLKNPVVLPDYVWDGYTWAKMFNEATYNWEGSYPSKANKTIRFSQEYLEELKYRSEHPNEFTEKWEINPANGEYVYYYSTDWYDELYKDFTTSNEHNLTISGSSEKTSYMISGRYLGQKGIFTYNSDDYEMLNFRAKGSIQVFPG